MKRNSIHQQKLTIRWLALCLVFCILLAACNPALPPPDSTTPTVESSEATHTPRPTVTRSAPTARPTETPAPANRLDVNPQDLHGLTINFWHAWEGAAGDVVEALIEQFNRQNEWGIFVESSDLDGYDEMFEQVNAALDDGAEPDLVVSYLYHAQAWDADNDVTDLSVFVEDPTWGWNSNGQVDYFPVFWEHDVVGGKRLGVPAQRSGQILFYNATWARSLGFNAAPRTPDEFAEQACAATSANQQDTDPENDGTGGWIISTDYPAVLGWLYAHDAQIVRGNPESERSGYRFDTSDVEEAFTFLRNLYDDDCAWVSKSVLPYDDFASRRGLFAVGSVIDIPEQINLLQQVSGRDRWTVIPFPSPDDSQAFTVFGPSFQVLSLSVERQLASWLLIRWLSTSENQAQLVEATGAYPLRASTLAELGDYGERYPQWLEAVDELTGSARAEPQFASWRLVRWTLTDAATQLFRSYFTVDQVSELVSFWDSTANELHRDWLDQ